MRYLRSALTLVVLLTALALYWASYAFFKSQELDKAAARLTLHRSTVESAIEHFSHLPLILSLDAIVIDTLEGGDPSRSNTRLATIAERADVEAIYLMNSEGLTISASNADTADSFVGQNYGYRPYFQAALRGERGEFYGIGATTGIPGYFYANRVETSKGSAGVIAIKLDLAGLQASWQASGERFILSNADGVVLLASEPGWRYRTLTQLAEAKRIRLDETRQFADEALEPLNWSRDVSNSSAIIDGVPYLYLQTRMLPNEWALHFFVSDDAAVTRAWLSTLALGLTTGLALITWQMWRVRQIRTALQLSEYEEAQLRQANERLAIEIEERRAAESTLKKTQSELERAGRLAALGQLASSVTHELGQPIAAMRNQLAAAEMSDGTSVLNTKMQALVARMEDITRQLKFFSRKGRDKFESVDLEHVINSALELLDANIQAADAHITLAKSSPHPTIVGNRLRLEQVVTNLVRNALDALENAPRRKIEIQLGHDDKRIWFEIADTGHGLEGKSLDYLQEPFTTTRESGKSMGLGLTISAGIVADHGGTLSAEDRDTAGTVFRVEIPRSTDGSNL